MKKRLLSLTAMVVFTCTAIPLVAQEDVKSLDRPNEIYGGYGAGSLYLFTGSIGHHYKVLEDYYYYSYTEEEDPTSIGTFFLGYNRKINKFLTVGFLVSYMHLDQDVTYIEDPYYTGDTIQHHGQNSDHLINGIAKVTINYLRKPFLTLYSGAAIGVTVDLSTITIEGQKETDRKLLPAGQLTLFGLRAGRALAGFVEFGVGTNGLINAGISYKIPD